MDVSWMICEAGRVGLACWVSGRLAGWSGGLYGLLTHSFVNGGIVFACIGLDTPFGRTSCFGLILRMTFLL